MALPPFQAFFAAHRREVLRVLAGIVGPHEADDCFQESFLAALRAYPTLAPDADLRGWILTIARRKAFDALRARARRPVPVAEPADRPGPPAPDGRPELWEAVAALPLKQRAALVLRFVADLPHADIARVLETSEEAARRNVHEGLRKLRQRRFT